MYTVLYNQNRRERKDRNGRTEKDDERERVLDQYAVRRYHRQGLRRERKGCSEEIRCVWEDFTPAVAAQPVATQLETLLTLNQPLFLEMGTSIESNTLKSENLSLTLFVDSREFRSQAPE